jgi:rod shape-determining protein MreD
MATLLLIVFGIALLVAQSAVATLVPMYGFAPNLLLPIVVFLGVAPDTSLLRGALVSFALGYVLDAFCGSPMGLHTLVMVAGFLAARGAGLRLFPQAAMLQVFAMFFAALGADITVFALRAIFDRPALAGLGEDVRSNLEVLGSSALATALCSPLVVAGVRRIEATRYKREERTIA